MRAASAQLSGRREVAGTGWTVTIVEGGYVHGQSSSLPRATSLPRPEERVDENAELPASWERAKSTGSRSSAGKDGLARLP